MNWYKKAQQPITRVDKILQEGLNQSQQHLHDNPHDASAMLDNMLLEGGEQVGARIFTVRLTPQQEAKLIKGQEPGEVILQETIPPSQLQLGWGEEGEGVYYHCTFDTRLEQKTAQEYPSIAIASYNNYGDLTIIFEGVRRKVYHNISPDRYGYLRSLLSHKNYSDAATLIDGWKEKDTETEEDRQEMLTELYNRGYLK